MAFDDRDSEERLDVDELGKNNYLQLCYVHDRKINGVAEGSTTVKLYSKEDRVHDRKINRTDDRKIDGLSEETTEGEG